MAQKPILDEQTDLHLDEAVAILNQIKGGTAQDTSNQVATMTMLGKRYMQNEGIKEQKKISLVGSKRMSKCFACSQFGHWVKDRA